jgi:predicted phage terminase large subunit-like protein
MKVDLHPPQHEVFSSEARYKVVAAGRRFGKSYLAAAMLFYEAAKNTKVRSDGVEIDLTTDVVYYVSPTFKQGRENLWNVCMDMGQGIIKNTRQNEGEIVLTNDRIIRFKGMDDPDSLRGVGLSYCILDEYAFMKSEGWEYIILPALMRAEGGAMFIGTPDGKNHFYDLYQYAEHSGDPEWAAWHFASVDNPHLTKNEINAMAKKLSKEALKQELYASFTSTGGKVFNANMFDIISEEEADKEYGEYVISCDLAGYSQTNARRGTKEILDDHAIAIVKVTKKGWIVYDVINGKWDVRETALRILRAWQKYRPSSLGIEKGIAMQAVLPYLEELQQKHQLYFEPAALTHGNNKKEDRIKWSLQGRAEEGKIKLVEGDWNEKFLSQAIDFPNPLSHDDLIDAVSYTDQHADASLGWDLQVIDEWAPLDDLSGY